MIYIKMLGSLRNYIWDQIACGGATLYADLPTLLVEELTLILLEEQDDIADVGMKLFFHPNELSKTLYRLHEYRGIFENEHAVHRPDLLSLFDQKLAFLEWCKTHNMASAEIYYGG
jgi:hypothetical protein